MFRWFRRCVRKIGIFGVEVEFHPPTETGPVPSTATVQSPSGLDSPATGQHGSDSKWFVKWAPTPEVIAVRARYKDLIWAASGAEEIRRLLAEYWYQEQTTWTACSKHAWGATAEAAFFRAVAKTSDRQEGIDVIEGVQGNRY